MMLQVSHKLPRMADAGDSRSIFPGPAASNVEAEPNSCLKLNLGEAAGARRTAPGRRVGMLAIAALLLAAAGAQAQLVFSTPQAVGVASSAQSVTLTAQGTGTVSMVEVVTVGQTGLDFAAAASASTCGSAVFTSSNHTCTEPVTFTPTTPGLRMGAVVLLDSGSKVLATAYLSGVGQGGLAVLMPGNWERVAGGLKQAGGPKNGGPAINAQLHEPSSVALDGAGNIYIADSFNNQVRMVCAAKNSQTIAGVSYCSGAGIILEVAGMGVPQAGLTLDYPTGVALDGAGNLYIADNRNNVIREINAATGAIATVAGNGYINPVTGAGGYTGDNGPATAAELNFPQGVTVDVNGNLFIADQGNNVIRRVDAVTGIITTIAGGGAQTADGVLATNASLNMPFPVAFDSGGNMYIPDGGNNKVREVGAVGGLITPASTINTVVGNGALGDNCANGPTSGAALLTPSGVAVDAAGNLYISDPGDLCVRKTNSVSGQINQLAITGDFSMSESGATSGAQIFAPQGIFVDGVGNVYFADHYFMVVGVVQSERVALNFINPPVRQGAQSAPHDQGVENDGNASLDLSAITPDANAAVDPNNPPTTCSAPGFAMAEDADCTIGAIFAPTVSGDPLLANIDVTNSTTLNNPLDIILVGNATPVNATTVSVISSLNPSEFGVNVLFTATVSTGTGTGDLTGSVDFYDGATLLASGPVGASTTTGTTTSAGVKLNISTLAVGSHSITVTYDNSKDPGHSTSTSAPPLIQVVYEATRTFIKSNPASPSLIGASVTFTATVTVPDGGTYPLDGSVTFTDSLGALANNTVPVSAGGVATYTTAALLQGVNVITATYTPVTTTLIQGSDVSMDQDVVSSVGVSVTSAPNPATFGTVVTFSASVANIGSTAATGQVNIVIVPQGQTSPTYPVTVTLAGNPATGTATISTLPVGTYTATANYAGDKNYAASTGTLATPQVISLVQTTTTLAANPNPASAGQAIAITATVAPGTGTATPTGTVTFTDTFNGATVTLGTQALSATGAATINPSTLAPGTHSIVAAYSGDTDNAASTSAALSVAVSQTTTATTVTAAPSPAVVGTAIAFTATVVTNPAGGSPTGAVTFTAVGGAGNVALGASNLVAGAATVTYSTLPAGTYQITAAYAGDSNNAASSGTTSETVGLIPTTTDLSATTVNGETALVAVVQNSGVTGPTPTGTVTFYSGTNAIGTATLDANGVASVTPNLPAGTNTITATYGGDAIHTTSTSSAVTVTGAASNFTLTAAPATATLPTGQNVNLTVTLTSIGAFTDTIDLGCVGLPTGVVCEFSSNSLKLAANGTATTQLTLDSNNPLGGGATAMNRQSGNRAMSLAGLFLPFSMLMGCIVWRFRRRHANLFTMVLVLILSSAALLATGCAGFSQNSAAPGTYTIQVVGVGQTSNVTQFQTVTLNITK